MYWKEHLSGAWSSWIRKRSSFNSKRQILDVTTLDAELFFHRSTHGVVAHCNRLNIPPFSGELAPKNTITPTLQSVFGLSVMGRCRNMVAQHARHHQRQAASSVDMNSHLKVANTTILRLMDTRCSHSGSWSVAVLFWGTEKSQMLRSLTNPPETASV